MAWGVGGSSSYRVVATYGSWHTILAVSYVRFTSVAIQGSFPSGRESLSVESGVYGKYGRGWKGGRGHGVRSPVGATKVDGRSSEALP